VGEVLNSVQCSVCGQRRLSNVAKCPHCGAEEKIHKPVGGQAVAWVDSFPMRLTKCPRCSCTEIDRVSALVRRVSPIHVDATTLRELYPPERPGSSGWAYVVIPLVAGMAFAIISFVLAISIAAYYFAPGENAVLPPAARVVCEATPLLFFVLGAVLARSAMMRRWRMLDERSEDSELRRWTGEMEAWERLYYCAGCAYVTDPLVGRSSTPHGMRNLLDR
jgi:hypothetical protein